MTRLGQAVLDALSPPTKAEVNAAFDAWWATPWDSIESGVAYRAYEEVREAYQKGNSLYPR